MFPRKNRLRKDFEIQKVLKTGVTYRFPFFILKFLKSNFFQATVVVSKKIHKSAVKRNRLKRIFRNSIQNQNKELDSKGKLVFLPSPVTLEKKSTDLDFETKKALKFIKTKIN